MPGSFSRQQIAHHVAGGELIPLLCAVAEATGRRSLLDPSFRPRLQAEMITIPADGGVAEDVARVARERLVDAMMDMPRAGESQEHSALPVDELLSFMSADAADHADLLRHELGAANPQPHWHKREVSPDRAFVVGIIGAGQAGLAMAHALRQAGVDFVVFESNSGVGGAWYANAYPGCRLDTGRLAYSYSFAQRRDWRHNFTLREDLWAYYQTFAKDQGLLGQIEFDSQVVQARYQDDGKTWALTIKDVRSGAIRSTEVDVLISAVGVLNQPKRPDFPGVNRYEGEAVHSAEWHDGVAYRGKRVTVVGTGASAYQIAPAIADQVESLTIIQRSPPWMMPTPQYHKEISPESRWLQDQLPGYHRWLRLWEFWHSTIGKYALTKADPKWKGTESVSAANQRFRDDLVSRIKAQYVGREDLLPAVIPSYPVGAKRMLRDNGVWAQTLQRPNVQLVTEPIREFDAHGVVTADGRHHRSDLVVYATGFNASNYLGTLEVCGRNGVTLRDYWGDEARAYLGVSVPEFPNLFCLLGPNTGLVAIGSQTFMTECSVNYVMENIKLLLTRGLRTVEPTHEAYRSYIRWMDEGNSAMAWGAPGVQSWYRNERGVVVASWPYPLLTYWQVTRGVDMEKVEVKAC